MDTPRVLSIQSHVVSGYVGNKSAVFPMQLLGFEVDFINSVQFSNHTGYKFIKGQVLTEKELAELAAGLSENGIDNYNFLLTGYIGSPGFLKEIVNLQKQLKKKNPNLIYVCDPVMGDNGKLYVPEELVPLYREIMVPIATIMVPNLFEAQLLTQTKIQSFDDVWNAISILHNRGVETVCISSAEIPSASKEKLYVFGSTKRGTSSKVQMEIQKVPAVFTGTGDLFSSLFLCHMHKTGFNLRDSLQKTISSLQAVIRNTYHALKGNDANPRNMELKLVQSREEILNPTIIYDVKVLE